MKTEEEIKEYLQMIEENLATAIRNDDERIINFLGCEKEILKWVLK